MGDDRHLQQEDFDEHDVTGEVSSEGGSAGNVEVHRDEAPATGSEATETWIPAQERKTEVIRDETGRGRRSP